jgi:decarbamoylnovobiocin carbamoyltransferase/7-O-carbamoyltransferase
MLVLGLSGNFSAEDVDIVPGMLDFVLHDASACLVRDGVTVAAVEEERFNRIKKTTKFPVNAIRGCLEAANVSPQEIDAVGYYFREDFTDQTLNWLYTENPTVSLRFSRDLIRDRLKTEYNWDLPADRIFYTQHHDAHAVGCFVRSGMDEALVLVMDGRGEEDCGSVYRAEPDRLERLHTYSVIVSLGALYQQGIQLLAYRFGDEYKVMGLAPYGNPARYRELFQSLYTLGEKGEYYIHPKMLGVNMVGPTFFDEGFLPRRKGEKLTQEHMDFAAGLQEALETIIMHVLTHWQQQTGLENLCFAGGVAHNSTLNGRILQSGLFREVFIHPASHDSGAAEGAALAASYRLGAEPYRLPRLRTASFGPTLGSTEQIRQRLDSWRDLVEYEQVSDPVETAAGLLADGAVLGWAQGGSEFGPRALGNRSIIADARPAENQTKINAMVKKRESFRPFAPVVTPEAADTYFDLPATKADYDFMSFVIDVREDRRKELGAVTHVDGSARVQIVDPEANEQFYRLVKRFGELTGTPVLLNTSFNNNAEPIVQTTDDVLTCLLTTDLDLLVMDSFLVRRRTDAKPAFDDYVLRFRPVTRLAKRTRLTMQGAREVVHEIYLDYFTGTRAQVSPAVYTLLANVDGKSSLRSLAGAEGISAETRCELFDLWQERYFVLEPPK